MKKKIISLFIAFVFCFTSFVPFSVSAADTSWLSPSDFFVKGSSVSNSSFNTTLTALQSLFDRNNINYNNYYIVVSDSSVTSGKHALMFPKGNESLSNYNFTSSFDGSTYNVYTGDNIYVIADDFSGVSLFANSYQSNKYGLCKNDIGYYGCQFSNKVVNNVFTSPYFIYFSTLNVSLLPEDVPPVDPSFIGPYKGLNLDFDPNGFYDWIIDNNKLTSLPSYIVQSKLLSFLYFYKEYGSSYTSFATSIKDWFSYMNIANQTADNVSILKNSIDNLYREYISNYLVTFYPNTKNHFHHRQNIDTVTNDDDLTLVTDDSNDTLDISILRDILRGVIAVSNAITSNFQALFDKIDNLNFTLSVTSNGGSSSDIWGSGDITQSSNYQALSDAFVEHGVIISDVESLQYNYLAGQTQKDSFTVSVDMPDEYINGEFTKKTITHTVDSNSKMYDTLVLFRKIIALAVILFYVVRLKLALPSLIKGE